MVPLSTGNLLIENYAYPEDRGEWEWLSFNTNQAIQYFDSLLVPYPFMREKYGHAQFGWGGGMEHQTMSFMADIGSWLMSHELAHQWFGDYITCGSWKDIWLNESFATYLTGLFYERFSDGFFSIWKGIQKNYVMELPNGKVLVSDTAQVDSIFNPRLTYSKGAMVLNMLRLELGDEVFFSGIRSYLRDSSLLACFAFTNDFIRNIESVSALDLGWFFEQWLEKEGYPILTIDWSQAKDKVKIEILQKQSVPFETIFTLKLPISVFSQGKEQIEWLKINQNFNEFEFSFPYLVDSIVVDRQNDVLAKTIVKQVDAEDNEIIVYPNPGNGEFTIKSSINLQKQGLKLTNSLGQNIPIQLIEEYHGYSIQVIPNRKLPAGIYFIDYLGSKETSRKKYIVTR
jgi:aminopeptidase N